MPSFESVDGNLYSTRLLRFRRFCLELTWRRDRSSAWIAVVSGEGMRLLKFRRSRPFASYSVRLGD
jgi:hypothetical protein